jgi:hypothetical protein
MLVIHPLSYHLRAESVVTDLLSSRVGHYCIYATGTLFPCHLLLFRVFTSFWYSKRQQHLSVLIQYYSHREVIHSFLAYFLHCVKKYNDIIMLSAFVCLHFAFFYELTLFCEVMYEHRFRNSSSSLDYLGAFTEVVRGTISFVTSARLLVRIGQFGPHRKNFYEILYLNIFPKSVEESQVSLKSDKNNRYFIWRSVFIYNNISLNFS